MSVKKKRDDYTIGWICALEVELFAAVTMFDEEHEPLKQASHDQNSYMYGSIGKHNMVIATMGGETGKVTAALVAASMWQNFTNLKYILLVGTGGGVPSQKDDVRLGDVVIALPQGTSSGVIQYDLGKLLTHREFQMKGNLAPPPPQLRRLVGGPFEMDIRRGRSRIKEISTRVGEKREDLRYPGSPADIQFDPSYLHQGGSDCSQCDPSKITSRRPQGREIKVHYGLTASGDTLMKDGAERDRISAKLGGILCFEMETAGLLTELPCLVIRGISNYCDSHKSDEWNGYAAATAAACAKEILQKLPAEAVRLTKPILKAIEANTRP